MGDGACVARAWMEVFSVRAMLFMFLRRALFIIVQPYIIAHPIHPHSPRDSPLAPLRVLIAKHCAPASRPQPQEP